MSKNVAVFVDVANIFYAAKAAGIDIDYVTLLKSATAGRDFVRAYAYTGLDPENENQRQFHSFLARNGYKVISKDIRKYGDGRIKANLDIELVVDMMKTARNLDIAVVVSGDGDFAPAIRAVQEQGVRVEVISFRGNTSSDLIDVADQFTDIAQIARVEKASARSGRRVAAEGDLSMTEVPEKETEGALRRRRGRPRDERPAVVPAALASASGPIGVRGQGNLVALPGERLSRRTNGEVVDPVAEPLAPSDMAALVDAADVDAADYAAGSENGRDAALDDGQRRRRRRGGRGRGRGRRGEETFASTDGAVPVAGTPTAGDALSAAGADEEEEDFEELAPTQPPHHAFGSVWDSQIGVPSAPTSVTSSSAAPGIGGQSEDDEDLDEPEVPEYLLAERRQGGQRQGGRGRVPGGNRSAYQTALNRERFGRGTPQPSFGGSPRPDRGPDRRPDRGPDRDRSRDRGRGGRSPQGRPMDRSPRPDNRPMTSEPRSAEPWSEVPPELEQLLRAELARKTPVSEPQSRQEAPAAQMSTPEAPAEVASPKARTTRTRTPKAAAASSVEASASPATTKAPAAKSSAAKPKPRTTRARTTKTAAPAKATAAAAEAPKKPATNRRKAAAPAEEG